MKPLYQNHRANLVPFASFLILCLHVFAGGSMAAAQSAGLPKQRVTLDVLAYNVYMIDAWPWKTTPGRSTRGSLLPLYLRGHDVLVLSEAFDDGVRERMLDDLRPEYPYQTDILGASRGLNMNGGVIILSRHPIVATQQHIFEACHGWDCQASKGVFYAQIQKEGRNFHILGTHMDADESDLIYNNLRLDAQARDAQIAAIKRLIDSRGIPFDEPVLIAGDLNVDRYGMNWRGDSQESYLPAAQFQLMLHTLGAAHPTQIGHPYSSDSETNDVKDGKGSELLDYVLYSQRHLNPVSAYNEVRFMKLPSPWQEVVWLRSGWQGSSYRLEDHYDLSDHHAVLGHFEFEFGHQPIGALESIDPASGLVRGWTLDPDLATRSIDVHFYVDGPAGVGQYAGWALAHGPRPDVNAFTGLAGDHGFAYPIPEIYRDGRDHTIWAYGLDVTGDYNRVLDSSPLSFNIPSQKSLSLELAVQSSMLGVRSFTINARDAHSGQPVSGTISDDRGIVSGQPTGQAFAYFPLGQTVFTIHAPGYNPTSITYVPGGGRQAAKGAAVTGAATEDLSGIRVYPNPTGPATSLTVGLPAGFQGQGTLSLQTLDGKPVRRAKMEGGSNRIQVADLPDGIYILQVTSGANTTTRRIYIGR